MINVRIRGAFRFKVLLLLLLIMPLHDLEKNYFCIPLVGEEKNNNRNLKNKNLNGCSQSHE